MKVDIDKGLIDEGVKALRIGDLKGAAHKIHHAHKKVIDEAMEEILESGESEVAATQPVFYMCSGIPLFMNIKDEEDLDEGDLEKLHLVVEEISNKMASSLIEKGETFCHVRCKMFGPPETDEATGGVLITIAVEGKNNRTHSKAEVYKIMDKKVKWEVFMDQSKEVKKKNE